MHLSLAFLCGCMISVGLSRFVPVSQHFVVLHGFAHGMVVTTKGSRLDASLLQVKRGQDIASVCGRFAVHHP